MGKKFSYLLVGASLVVLAGCTGGTTYGTGSSHEEDTMKSIVNLLAVTPDEKESIDYSARPELIMPANQQALPAPVDEKSVAQENWPISPEQRIAAVRAGVPEADWRSGDLPTEYLTSEKDGISNSAGLYRVSRAHTRSGSDRFIDAIRDDANGSGENAEARRIREELSYSTGVQRKYLTEPPSEYRRPADTAEAGDLGITKEQITAAQKKAEQDKRLIDGGVLNPVE